ncbi:hypothetical protein LTR62_004968 [Meristemomyces frigidus]|uniref:Rhodopsin domain-containing protein n=1 Tax=Meristemomyces frigidus TaxID=1508187 RepID=A0AAN7TP70_9PEZI|nr:hypothetical protein LTR62_004968 [Meristemomyces frigidus]
MILCGVYATAIYATSNKLAGIHIWDADFSAIRDEALNAWIGAFLFVSGTCCLKVSVLLFYRRLKAGTYNKKWSYAIWVAIGFTITYTVGMILALILNCNPTQAYWLAYDAEWEAEHNYTCASTGSLNLVAGILSIVTDIYSIALPCSVAQGLKIHPRQKITLNIMFGLSSVTIGAAIARTYLYYKLSWDYDFTWLAFDVYFWTMLEFGLGIICACAPSLRVFAKKFLGVRSITTSASALSSGRSRWSGKKRTHDRSESQGELYHEPELGTPDETRPSAITRKTTVEVSSTSSTEKSDEYELQAVALPVSVLPKPYARSRATAESLSVKSAKYSAGSNGPVSPKDYEKHALDMLKDGRELYLKGLATRETRPSLAGHAL